MGRFQRVAERYVGRMKFREMTVADLPAAFEVRLSTVENAVTMAELERDFGITPENTAAAMTATVRGWLCEEDGAMLGFAMGERETGEVLVVAVLPAAEGRGVGKGVLGRVRDWLFAEGHDEIWLQANPSATVRATGFYRHLGWRDEGERVGGHAVLRLRAG